MKKPPPSGTLVTYFGGFLVLATLLLATALNAAAAGNVVRLEIHHSRDGYPTGGTYPVMIRLKIAEGHYIHEEKREHGDDEALIPTELSLETPAGIGVAEISFPDPEPMNFGYSPKPVPVYKGSVLVRVLLSVKQGAPEGVAPLKATLRYQACTSTSCLAPETTTQHAPLMILAKGAPSSEINAHLFEPSTAPPKKIKGIPGIPAGAGLALTLAFLFIGGLSLNLTPCVYPLIPITVSYFGGRTKTGLGTSLVHGGLYMLGLAVTNSLLGVFAALSGGLLGSALQSPWAVGLIALVLVVMALSFFDVWEIRLPAALNRAASKQYGGCFGSFFMGLTLGIMAAPCLGPFILALLVYVGQVGDPVLGFAYFFALSLGLGLPLALLGVFSSAIDRLPGSGDWMIWVRRLFGWVLLGMAAYLILPHLFSNTLELLLPGILAASAGIHLGWIEKTGRASRRFRVFRRAVGTLLIAAGVVFVYYASLDRPGIEWTPYTQEAVARASEQGRPVLLGFSADWCVPCKELEERVFKDPKVLAESRKTLNLRVDLTRTSPENERTRKRYSAHGVPTVIFIDKKGNEIKELRVQAYVSPRDFLQRMERLTSE